jgi:hypothetical protein
MRLLLVLLLLLNGCAVAIGASAGYLVGSAYEVYSEAQADRERAESFEHFESVMSDRGGLNVTSKASS